MPGTSTISVDRERSEGALRRLQIALRFVGSSWAIFFSAIVFNELSGSILWSRDDLCGKVVLWGYGGQEYLLMICAINIPLGIFLAAAAKKPVRHRMFLDFAITANLAHMVTMLLMALFEPSQRVHAASDVPAGLIPNLVLAALWLPVRGREEHPAPSVASPV